MTQRTEQIIALRRERKPYKDIGAIVGLSKQAVQQVLKKHAPELIGYHQVDRRRVWRKYPNAPLPSRSTAYHRWYRQNVTIPKQAIDRTSTPTYPIENNQPNGN